MSSINPVSKLLILGVIVAVIVAGASIVFLLPNKATDQHSRIDAGPIESGLSVSSITLGDSVIYSVIVPSNGTNTPTGTVKFQVQIGSGLWTTYNNVTMSANGTKGVANSTAYTPLAVNSYHFRANYSGDVNYLSSQSGDADEPLTVNPVQVVPTTVLSKTNITLGDSIIDSVTISGIGARFPVPSGSVQFQVQIGSGMWTAYDNETLSALGTDGVAYSIEYLPSAVNAYHFRVNYSGDVNYLSSQSGDADKPLTVNLMHVGPITTVLSQTTIDLGGSVTASVTVSRNETNPLVPTGAVAFQVKIGSGAWTTYDTKTLTTSGTNGVATSAAYTPSAVNSYDFRAIYSGDSNYSGSQSGDEHLTVNTGIKAVSVTTVLSQTTIDLGSSVTDSVTVQAQVADPLVPGGTVEFQVKIGSGQWTTYNTTTLTTSGTNGVATSAAYTPSAVNSYNFRALYRGDVNFETGHSGDADEPLTVNQVQNVPVTTVLSQTTIDLGGSVTASVTVQGLGANFAVPTGTVDFQVQTGFGEWTTYNTTTLTAIGTNGVAISAAYAPSMVNLYNFRTNYSGDINYLSSHSGDADALLTVNYGPGSISVTTVLSQTTIDLGSSVTDSATVSGLAADSPVPTGAVEFQVRIGSGEWTTYNTKTLIASGNNAVATSIAYRPYTVDSYHFRALYRGDVNFMTGHSGDADEPLTVNRIQVGSPMNIEISNSTITFGRNVSTSMVVHAPGPSLPLPTGAVEFQVRTGSGPWSTYETKTLGTNGVATSIYTPLAVDSYDFRALYLGDVNYVTANSSNITALTVGKADTFSTAPLGFSSIQLGQSVRDNVTVFGVNGSSILPTGTVSFQVRNGTGLWQIYDADVPLINGKAISTWYTPMHTAVDFKFQALYSGDSNYYGSHSCPFSVHLNVLVAMPSTSINIGGAVTGHVGQSYTVNTTITGLGGAYPPITGTVDFQWQLDGAVGWTNITQNVNLVNGVATSTWFAPSDPGRYIFRVVYTGDANYHGSDAAVALQVYV